MIHRTGSNHVVTAYQLQLGATYTISKDDYDSYLWPIVYNSSGAIMFKVYTSNDSDATAHYWEFDASGNIKYSSKTVVSVS